MRRVVEPELLDSLPPDHPDAIRCRGDLRRLNRWMRNHAHLLAAIRRLPEIPRAILEVGAGDGTFMLRLVQRLQKHSCAPGRICLLDMEPVISQETLAGFSALGCDVEVIRANLHDWLKQSQRPEIDLTLANLFLHHFSEDHLASFFRAFAETTRAFITCEPRRWKPSLISTRLLWAIGCNHVTRHDAYVSVRAGFRDRELTSLWPAQSGFELTEYPAGYASHCFIAVKNNEGVLSNVS